MTKLYESDFFAWTQDQADALRRRSINQLDWENLLEEVESLGRQERNQLESRLIVLLIHLLKWEHQPARRGRSWELTILEQRNRAQQLLDQNPSLKPVIPEIVASAYRLARIRTARQTGLSIKRFPKDSPYDWQSAMTEPPVGEDD